jgi:anti-anti-sigma regulatory factor
MASRSIGTEVPSLPSVRVTLRGGFRIDRLELVIAEVSKLSRLAQPAQLVLDLSGLVFIGPASLATLCPP